MAEKNAAIVTLRAKKAVYLPPAEKGYDDLLKPNEYKGESKYNLDAHFRPEAISLIPNIITTRCYEPLLEALYGEIVENGGRKKDPMDPEEWLENKLKQPTKKLQPQLPFIKLSREAETKAGKQIVMGCWGPDGQVLDMGKLRMAMGTVIQPAVFLNIWASKAANWVPQVSVKLVGVKVLKLVQYGGQSGRPDDDDASIQAVLGSSFEGTDLSAFAAGEDVEHDHEEQSDDPVKNVKEMF